MFGRIKEVIEDIKKGKMIIIVDDDNPENEGVLAMASELATKEAVNFMMKNGRGLIRIALTEERLEELNLPQVVERNENTHTKAL